MWSSAFFRLDLAEKERDADGFNTVTLKKHKTYQYKIQKNVKLVKKQTYYDQKYNGTELASLTF